jgi:recombination protein RecT
MTNQSAPAQGTAIAQRDNSPFGQFQRQLATRADEIQMALPAGISAQKFQRTIATTVAQNGDLLRADRQSLILACYKAAQDGLLPDGREAALVVFSTRRKNPETGNWESVKLVQYMPMVYGLRKKILQAKDADGNPIVSALQVGVVFKIEVEQGYFLWERGSDPEVQHRPMMEITAEQAADENIIAAYSIATMRDGTRSCEVMRRFEIDQVRQMSQTGAMGQTAKWDDGKNGIKKGDPVPPKGPWVEWFAEMAKKTVMRRHAKTLPMSGDVIADLGGEDDELRAGRSSALFLGGATPDEPELITDESGAQIDPATGEIIKDGGDGDGDQGQGADDTQAEPEKAGKTAKPKAPKKKDEAEPEKASGGEPAAADGQELARDEQTGVTQDPAESKAAAIEERFKAATTIVDLEKIYKDTRLERGSMPDEIFDALEASYTQEKHRLAPAKAPQPEHAE